MISSTMHANKHTQTRMHASADVRTHVRTYARTHTHTHTHTRVHDLQTLAPNKSKCRSVSSCNEFSKSHRSYLDFSPRRIALSATRRTPNRNRSCAEVWMNCWSSWRCGAAVTTQCSLCTACCRTAMAEPRSRPCIIQTHHAEHRITSALASADEVNGKYI